MSNRSGPFWDAAEGRAPLPPAAATLGLEVVEVDPDAGTIELAFHPTEAFTNPTGNVLGDIVFLEASLTNADGELAAISTTTAQVIPLADARDAA